MVNGRRLISGLNAAVVLFAASGALYFGVFAPDASAAPAPVADMPLPLQKLSPAPVAPTAATRPQLELLPVDTPAPADLPALADLKNWLQRNDGQPSPKSDQQPGQQAAPLPSWILSRPAPAVIAELVALTGAREYQPAPPDAPHDTRRFTSGGVYFTVDYPAGTVVHGRPTAPAETLTVQVDPWAYPTPQTLLMADLQADPDRVRRVLRAEGFTTADGRIFDHPRLDGSAVASVARRLHTMGWQKALGDANFVNLVAENLPVVICMNGIPAANWARIPYNHRAYPSLDAPPRFDLIGAPVADLEIDLAADTAGSYLGSDAAQE